MRAAATLALSLTLGLSACSSSEPAATDTTEPAADDTTAEAPDAEASGGAVTFVGTDDVAWSETEKSTAPGTVEVTIECGEAVNHGLAIEGVQGGDELAACGPGGQGTATVELEAGQYTFFCTVPGHRDAGMEGTLAVG